MKALPQYCALTSEKNYYGAAQWEIIPKRWPKVEKSKSEFGTFSHINYS
jgi:hypothetical protein